MTMNGGRPVLDCIMHKLPSTRKYYRVSLIVPDNGIPTIQYSRANGSKKPQKSIPFVDLLFADKKHDTNEKFAFSIYTTCKTTTFLAQDEATMNEWLTRIREYHSALYPEFKRYDAIFEANIVDKGLARTMNIKGNYRLALCKESLDLMPLLTATAINEQQQSIFKAPSVNTLSSSSSSSSSPSTTQSKAPKTSSHATATTTTPSITSSVTTKLSTNFHNLHNHIMNHHQPHHLTNINNPINPNTSITPHSNYHPHIPQHLPSHQRFCKRHPLLMSKTIELVLRSIRRCGHTDSNFYIESGRHSQIGEGDLWMTLNKKATARQLHELLLATMKLASTMEDQYYKAPRSRSGSSSDNAHRSQQSRSSSIVCLNASEFTSNGANNTTSSSSSSSSATITSTMAPLAAAAAAAAAVAAAAATGTTTTTAGATPGTVTTALINSTNGNGNIITNVNNNNNNNNNNNSLININQLVQSAVSVSATAASSALNSISTIPMFTSNNKIDEDTGYLPMA